MSLSIEAGSDVHEEQALRACLLTLTRAVLQCSGYCVAPAQPLATPTLSQPQIRLPAVAAAAPAVTIKRPDPTGETKVIPSVLKIAAKPVDLEFPAALPEELWLDLQAMQHLPARLKLPSDGVARHKAYRWRREQLSVDILMLAARPFDGVVEKLCLAIEEHYCPTALLDAGTLTTEEGARDVVMRPEVRLIICTPQLLQTHPLLRRLAEGAAGRQLSWHGKPIMVLPALNDLESNAAVKSELWRKLAQWRRPV